MTNRILPLTLGVIAGALIFAGLPTAEANPTPIPYYDEPAPFCGSTLALSGLVAACSDRDRTAAFTRDGHDCPDGLSAARLEGRIYRTPPLTYNEAVAPNGPQRQQAIDRINAIETEYGAWVNWCVPSRIVPTPEPTATPVVIVVERPSPAFTG